jgi:phytoene/squalene synthetase
MSRGENFPVGSWLVRRDLRRPVAAFYAFARAADDVADDPRLAPKPSSPRSVASRRGSTRGDARGDGAAGGARGPSGCLRHARQLLRAFRWDAEGRRVGTWADLLGYCEDSANPVGRFLLDLHGEDPGGAWASDALCTALQILNHLQDLREDHLRLDRCYLPAAWVEGEDLAARALSPGLRRAVDDALDRCDALLGAAGTLPGAMRSRGLGAEAAAILHLGRRLASRLRRGDPMAGRVTASRLDWAAAGAWGLGHLLAPRARLLAARGRA